MFVDGTEITIKTDKPFKLNFTIEMNQTRKSDGKGSSISIPFSFTVTCKSFSLVSNDSLQIDFVYGEGDRQKFYGVNQFNSLLLVDPLRSVTYELKANISGTQGELTAEM